MCCQPANDRVLMKPAEFSHSTMTQADITANVLHLQVCSTSPTSFFWFWLLNWNLEWFKVHPMGVAFIIWKAVFLCDCTKGRQQQKVGHLNLVFITKYQADCWDNRVWQYRIKCSRGEFIPCPLLLLCLSPSLTAPLVRSSFNATWCSSMSDPCSQNKTLGQIFSTINTKSA